VRRSFLEESGSQENIENDCRELSSLLAAWKLWSCLTASKSTRKLPENDDTLSHKIARLLPKGGFMQMTTVLRWSLVPVVLAGILVIAPLAAAQDSYWGLQPGPSIVATAGMVPTTDLAQPGQSYGSRDAGLRVRVPLIGGWDWDSNEMSKFRLLAFAGFKADSALVPYMSGRQDLYALDAGVSAIHALNPKHEITWSVGAGFAEDSSTISSPRVKVTGRVVAAYRKSDSLTLLYGGAYTFVLGEGKLLPVFGFRWRPRPGTTVSVLGPFAGHVHQRVNQRLMVGAQAGLRGNQYHIQNNEQFSSPTNNLYLRLKELRLGGQVGIRLNRSVALLGEAGVATARTLTFADGKTRLSSLDAGAKPYVSISLRYSFSKQEHWEEFGR
jgi:hypothetical protein